MTAQRKMTRDQLAEITVDEVIRETLTAPAPQEIKVSARDNHSGEPSLYVYVLMPEERDIPDIATQNRLGGKLLSALQAADDSRFPYVYYGPRHPDARDPTRKSG